MKQENELKNELRVQEEALARAGQTAAACSSRAAEIHAVYEALLKVKEAWTERRTQDSALDRADYLHFQGDACEHRYLPEIQYLLDAELQIILAIDRNLDRLLLEEHRARAEEAEARGLYGSILNAVDYIRTRLLQGAN